jgi:RNA polymerase sigma-70 factor, ECF subfamily
MGNCLFSRKGLYSRAEMSLESAPQGAQAGSSQPEMDHAATARVQFLASVSQADELCETSRARLATSEDGADEVLLEQAARGTQEALAVLFRRYARRVRNIGWRILHDPAEADDLVQEVFLYVFRKSRLYDPSKGPARSWLIQIAYTQGFLRRRELNSRSFYGSAVTDRPAETDPPFVQATHHDYTVEAFFGQKGWKKVWDSLTEYQRETLRLHFYDGCTFAEIAEKLGQSYVNIRHHYYRGLEKLRKHADENDLNWP